MRAEDRIARRRGPFSGRKPASRFFSITRNSEEPPGGYAETCDDVRLSRRFGKCQRGPDVADVAAEGSRKWSSAVVGPSDEQLLEVPGVSSSDAVQLGLGELAEAELADGLE